MNKNEIEKKNENIISFNEVFYNIILESDKSKQNLLISVYDENNSFYKIELSLKELIQFCKVFKSCDSISDAQIMLHNYFKSKKAGIKDISKNILNIYVKAEVLGEEKMLELSLKKQTPYETNTKSSKDEMTKLKFEQKILSSRLESALNTINELKNILQESKINNSIIKNQIQELNNSEGDKYFGNVYNNKKEGRGTIDFKNGDRYVGEWSNNLMDGKGVYYYNSGNKYDGYFIEGKRNGKGIMFYKNGDKYDGEWKNNLFDGFGILYYRNGKRYIGEFQNDKIHGKGVMYYNNGDKYEGDWRRDSREGNGVMFFIDGERYEGEWANNKMDGFGRYYYRNGDIEEGMYKEGKKVGSHKKYIASYQIKELFY